MGKKEKFYVDVMSVHPEVTGSCNLVITKLPNGETIRFIVDCGLFQEKGYDEFNKSLPFDSEKVDFCLITHNHVDHTGRLPLLIKNGFVGKIYTTETTGKLLPLALNDSFKVLRDVSKRKHTRCLYDETDVEQTLKKIKTCKFYEMEYVNPFVKVMFLNNGHLIGAALILVQISYPECENINILFTGDYNNKNMFFDVNPIPKWILDLPLTVIQESTYGDMDSSEMQPVMKSNLLECIENKGTVVCPVFSLGRSQEILYELKCMQDSKVLDTTIPVYFDGKLAINYTNLYLYSDLGIKEEMKSFLPQNLTLVDKMNRASILNSRKSKIILTTSGMGSYGPAQMYIPEYITRKEALIHFTGYTAEGTLGNRLKNTEVGEIVEIGGQFVKKMAKVEYTTEYSAHAKANEMISFLNQFNNLKLILVNHGEEEVKKIFAKRIVEEVNCRHIGILGNEFFSELLLLACGKLYLQNLSKPISYTLS